MNGSEQRQQRTADLTATLADRLIGVETELAAHRDAIDRSRTEVLHLHQVRRDDMDRADARLEAQIRALRDRTLWQRLRWLLVGR